MRRCRADPKATHRQCERRRSLSHLEQGYESTWAQGKGYKGRRSPPVTQTGRQPGLFLQGSTGLHWLLAVKRLRYGSGSFSRILNSRIYVARLSYMILPFAPVQQRSLKKIVTGDTAEGQSTELSN